jgi:hypothetical protein
VWTAEQYARADELVDQLVVEGRITAMKDPRSLYTGDGWRARAAAAGAEIAHIGTVRRPERVIASLTARDPALDPVRCGQLWAAYNTRLIRLHDRSPFPIVDFDLPADRYLESVRSAFAAIGLDSPDQLGFFEQDLRHQGVDAGVDPEIEAIHAELQRRCVSAGPT